MDIGNISAAVSTLRLNLDAFKQLCHNMFTGVDDASVNAVFHTFDLDKDGHLESDIERQTLNTWLNNACSRRRSALIIVDVQNDFVNGTLSIRNGSAKQNPEAIIKPINELLARTTFDAVVYTQDWHPADHISFVENAGRRKRQQDGMANETPPKVGDLAHFVCAGGVVEQRLWPAHCVQNTPGAELYVDLRLVSGRLTIRKGTDPEIDSYSAFFDNGDWTRKTSELHAELQQRCVTDVYVCGLAYDYCVGWTARDALQLGYRTAIVEDCTAGLAVESMRAVQKELAEHRLGLLTESQTVTDILTGKRTPWKWAVAQMQEENN